MSSGDGRTPGGYSSLNLIIPNLSTMIMARLGAPFASLKSSYRFAMWPWGLKSARSGYWIFPSELDHARCECWLSQLIPKTWALFSSNWVLALLKEETWLVQPPVKSNTWKANTTSFSLLNFDKETCSPVWSGKLKSGATSPTFADMNTPPVDNVPLCFNGPRIVSGLAIIHIATDCYYLTHAYVLDCMKLVS